MRFTLLTKILKTVTIHHLLQLLEVNTNVYGLF